MRMEALENPNYMQQVKDDIERTQQETMAMRQLNYRL